MKRDYEICIVGAGMFGSSAAKYLSSEFGSDVLLIGPSEPSKQDYGSRDIFGAYYDEGRITRTLDIDPLWGQLAARSIPRYREIERKSGISFYKENGYLSGGPQNSGFIEENIETAKLTKTQLIHLSEKEMKKVFPYINPPDDKVKSIFNGDKRRGILEIPSGMIEYNCDDGKKMAEGSYHKHPRFLFFMMPLLYPDGKYYLKIGDSFDFWKVVLETPQDVTNWCKTGHQKCQTDATSLAKVAKSLLPDLELDSSNFVVDVCVIGTTPSQRPYIDKIGDNIFVATGGNGYGAKSSDEIGRLGIILKRPSNDVFFQEHNNF